MPLFLGSCDFLGQSCAGQQGGLVLSAWKVKDSHKRAGAIDSNGTVLLEAWTQNGRLCGPCAPKARPHFLAVWVTAKQH